MEEKEDWLSLRDLLLLKVTDGKNGQVFGVVFGGGMQGKGNAASRILEVGWG